MFERYNEKARRVIFFARYEASQYGSPYIETEHMLLGLLREDKALTNRFLRSHASVEAIRQQIQQRTVVRDKVSTAVDLPLSNDGKRVLAYAAEESDSLGHQHIGTEHLLLGLLREEKCFAAEILRERGLSAASMREELRRVPHVPEAAHAHRFDGPTKPPEVTDARAVIDLDKVVELVAGPHKSIESLMDALVERLNLRIQFIESAVEEAIANHEFEKARSYSEEEHKRRGQLTLLQEKRQGGPE